MREFNVIAVKRDVTEDDIKVYDALPDNVKRVYTFFSSLTEIAPKNIWELDIDYCSSRVQISEEAFTAALKELCDNNYFMYYVEQESLYVFGTSRMVF